MWVMNNSGWFVCELRGVCFLTWVKEKDNANAAVFPKAEIHRWVSILSEMAGEELVAIDPYS